MELQSSAHGVFSLGVHLVWCTKFRREVLRGLIEYDLKQIICETCRTYGWSVESLEVMPDHVHLFVGITPSDAVSDVVRTLKSISAVFLFTRYPDLKATKFWGSGLWSRSFYAGSVGDVTETIIKNYIESQKKK